LFSWEQRKLIYIFNDFIVPMRDKPKVFSGTTPWTRIEDIEGRYINTSLSGQFVSDEIIKSMNLKVIPRGSLIVSASATFGVVAIVTNDLITNQTFIGLVPNKDFDIDFLYSLFEVSIDSYTTYLVKNNSPKKYLVIISTFISVVLAQVFLLSDTTRYSNVLGTNNWFFFIIMFIITIIYPVLVGIKIYRYVTRHDYIVKETNRKSNNDDEDEVIARKVEIIETPVKKEKEHEKDYYEDEFLNDFDDDNF